MCIKKDNSLKSSIFMAIKMLMLDRGVGAMCVFIKIDEALGVNTIYVLILKYRFDAM